MTGEMTHERCAVCGSEIPALAEIWAEGDYLCPDCAGVDDYDARESRLCKFGGPAPCIDDTCRAIDDCQGYAGDGQP